jgi:coenzyme F420 hydrogenase subunit beta
MSKQTFTITDVVEKQLCTGCGACAYAEPDRFRMANVYQLGRRPFLKPDPKAERGLGMQVCPGASLSHDPSVRQDSNIVAEMFDAWGPVYEVWEGYSGDEAIRYAGSSGGLATALALFCLEKEKMEGVLHTGADEKTPYLNKTVYSKTRSELVSNAGSRYSPASPCESLDLVEKADGKSVFIGKPCDVAAVQKARKINASLDNKIGLTIGFLKSLRFRGNGWPGLWTANYVDDNNQEKSSQLTYAESWGFLQKFRQWRCYICPDHSGEFADIAVGDPWYRQVTTDEPGKSLIVVRTKRGLDMLKAAEKAGYVVLEKKDLSLLPRSQPNLLDTRGAIWGRRLALKLAGASFPDYSGFAMFKFWWKVLSTKSKLQSITGTIKRVFVKKLHRRVSYSEWLGD